MAKDLTMLSEQELADILSSIPASAFDAIRENCTYEIVVRIRKVEHHEDSDEGVCDGK